MREINFIAYSMIISSSSGRLAHSHILASIAEGIALLYRFPMLFPVVVYVEARTRISTL